MMSLLNASAIVETRALHLDLKGLAPTPQRLVQLVPIIKAAGYNALLVEWEDAFPWTVDKRFRSETAYTPEQIKTFYNAASEHGVEIIPLVQCMAHLETALCLDDYAHLREIPDRNDVMNPLAEGAGDLIASMIDDALSLGGNITRFHLGGDEAWTFGSHPDTKAFIEQHGKGALYMHLVEPLLDKLNAKGIRPWLWHDMMRDWDDDSIRRLAEKADLIVWGYTGHPDDTESHYKTRYIERFHKLGVTLHGGTAYKGADGSSADRPDLEKRCENALAWTDIAKRFGFKSIIATGWSRYCTADVQCEPIDACLDALIWIGAILHNGASPDNPIECIDNTLKELGELETFRRCCEAMERLQNARKATWDKECETRHQIGMHELYHQRMADASRILLGCDALDDSIKKLEQFVEDIPHVFDGLVDRKWMELYMRERMVPLEQSLADIESRIRNIRTKPVETL